MTGQMQSIGAKIGSIMLSVNALDESHQAHLVCAQFILGQKILFDGSHHCQHKKSNFMWLDQWNRDNCSPVVTSARWTNGTFWKRFERYTPQGMKSTTMFRSVEISSRLIFLYLYRHIAFYHCFISRSQKTWRQLRIIMKLQWPNWVISNTKSTNK